MHLSMEMMVEFILTSTKSSFDIIKKESSLKKSQTIFAWDFFAFKTLFLKMYIIFRQSVLQYI